MPNNLDDLPAMDFKSLREEGIALLQRLAGDSWTDHNTHDPGITILEQLCYALTDLGYRTEYDLPDLLASGGEEPYASLWQPHEILPSGPVSLADLRKLVIDIDGVQNVWIEAIDEPAAIYDAATQEIAPRAPLGAGQGKAAVSPNLSDLRLRGLYRVLIEKSGRGTDFDGGRIVLEAARRLNRYRGLGDEFRSIVVLERQAVTLDAILEIEPAGDVADLLARVYERIAGYMSPDVPFHTLGEMLERGWRVDEVFEGPLLDNGFIDDDEFSRFTRRDSVRISDLIHAVLSVPGVLAVKRMNFLVNGESSRDWVLEIDPQRTAYLDIGESRIRLDRRSVRVDQDSVRAAARALFEQRSRESAAPGPRDDFVSVLQPRAGRDRGTGRYHSVQQQFPMTYGIGLAGLAGSESEERKAQARQLKAYLMFFDQLLANQFAQLRGVGRLLSIHDESADSYFAQAVDSDPDDPLRLAELQRLAPDEHARVLRRITESPERADEPGAQPGLVRRNRVLDHLLARVAERFADYTLLDAPAAPAVGGPPLAAAEAALARLVRDKRAFLRDYPRIGHDRGVARNALAEPADDALSGLELRLRRKLGLGADEARFYLIEHILLRPLSDDVFQSAPLMRNASAPDPYSLRFSLVFPGDAGQLADANFRAFVAQAVQDESPAHLLPSIVWLDSATLQTALVPALARFQDCWRTYQRFKLGLEPETSELGHHNARLRGARNRLIDLIGLGDTYPLTDLNVVADQLKVAFGATAKVPIEDAQAGVTYQLCDPKGLPLDGHSVDGIDDLVRLETPAVSQDTTFRILAIKLQADGKASTQTAHFLDQTAEVKVGLDTTLPIEFVDLPLLDPALQNPVAADARVAPYGSVVQVRVINTQEGVDYLLVVDGKPVGAAVHGRLTEILLPSGPMTEDAQFRVRATKTFLAADKRKDETELLDATLLLKVRANPAVALSIDPLPLLDYRAAASVLVLASQKSAAYRAFVRRVRDADFVRDPATPGLVTLQGSAAPGAAFPSDVSAMPGVLAPAPADPWVTPDGFVPVGDADLPGTGGDLKLPLDALTDDSLLIVRASKLHDPGAGAPPVRTEIGVAGALLALIRPDPDHALQLRVSMAAEGTAGPLHVAAGQPGVFYSFANVDGGTEVGRPAYFHQRDDRDVAVNKGLGQVAVLVDLVVAVDPDPADLAAQPDPAARAPAGPSIDIAVLPGGTALTVRAVKAQTGADASMTAGVSIPALPKIALSSPLADFGQPVTVVVSGSKAAERYVLAPAGSAPVGDPVAGKKAALKIDTPPISADSVFELHITRPGDKGQALEQVVTLPVAVMPDAARPVISPTDPVPAGASGDVLVQGSQPGVAYQLSIQGAAVGDALAGTGADLLLPTGPISADTVFEVIASRLAEPPGSLTLTTPATVTLQPAPPA